MDSYWDVLFAIDVDKFSLIISLPISGREATHRRFFALFAKSRWGQYLPPSVCMLMEANKRVDLLNYYSSGSK